VRKDYEWKDIYMKLAAGGKERDGRQRIGRRAPDGFGGAEGGTEFGRSVASRSPPDDALFLDGLVAQSG